MTTAQTTPKHVSGTIAAVADALDKWVEVMRDGRQIEPSVTVLRDMARVVRLAAIQTDPEPQRGSSKWGSDFPPRFCTPWEDCTHDGVCHDPDCGAPSQHGDDDDPEPQPVTWAVAVIARKEPQIGYRMRLSSAATEDEAIGESMRVFGELNPGWEIMQPAALPIHTTPSSAGTVSVEAWGDEACLRFAEGYDREDAAQRGEPSPHDADSEGYAEWATDRIGCVRAGLRALRAQAEALAQTWQPIDTAPEDKEILVCSTEPYDVCHVIMEDGEAHAVGDGGMFHDPTHWMPLPKPPAIAGKDAREGGV